MSEYISRSAQKRRVKDEEEVAAELALLTDRDLKLLPASQAVKDEIIRCRSVKGGARKRQVKYLAKVMREEPVEEILNFLAARKGSAVKENKMLREVERLRDVIINEAIEQQQFCLQEGLPWEPDWQGDEIDAALRRYPVDAGELRVAVHQYVKSRIQNYYREVFRIIRAAVEKEAMLRQRG